ncbi:MAG: hypothetical protein WCK91_01340 [bacterium]
MEKDSKYELTKTEAIILLIIFIAIGGIVLYGNNNAPKYETHR